jgi:PhnB protein
VTTRHAEPVISVMLGVHDTAAAVSWYRRALGARELWNLGSVVGMEVGGARFFFAQPERDDWASPSKAGTTTVRVELFCDDPDRVVERALLAGATGTLDTVRDHEMPWGTHRQGRFTDPFGHIWFVGDRSPLERFPR